MAVANSTGVRSRADHSGRIAPSYPLSPADQAAHRAASHRRGDSDPNMNEALRRAQENLAYLERKQQLAADVQADIAAAGVAA